MATKSIIYRIGGNSTTPARFVSLAPDATVKFCRVVRVEARALTPIADPVHTFLRVHVTCPDSTYAEIPLPAPPPFPLPPYLSDPPIPPMYPQQPLVVYDMAASFGTNMRAELGLMNVPDHVSPMGPMWYTYFPYVITLYSPATISAAITVQYA